MATASNRDWAVSFVRMLRVWVRTVWTLSTSSRTMTPGDLPSARSPRTSGSPLGASDHLEVVLRRQCSDQRLGHELMVVDHEDRCDAAPAPTVTFHLAALFPYDTADSSRPTRSVIYRARCVVRTEMTQLCHHRRF